MAPTEEIDWSTKTPLEKSQYSHKRASEVLFEHVSEKPEDRGWPSWEERTQFAICLLADAVRHLLDHEVETTKS